MHERRGRRVEQDRGVPVEIGGDGVVRTVIEPSGERAGQVLEFECRDLEHDLLAVGEDPVRQADRAFRLACERPHRECRTTIASHDRSGVSDQVCAQARGRLTRARGRHRRASSRSWGSSRLQG